MNPSSQQLNQYTCYLESQIQKFASFMLTQTKLNQKYLLVQTFVEKIDKRLNIIESKLKLIEINEKDHLLELRKIKAQKEILKSIELRIQNIQFQIQSLRQVQFLQKTKENDSLYQSSENCSKEQRNRQISSSLEKIQKIRSESKTKNELNIFKIKDIETHFTNIFMNKSEANNLIDTVKEDVQLKIKKLKVQIDKNKQSFFKLTASFNDFQNQNLFDTKVKNRQDSKIRTQSSKDLTIEPVTQQQIITKKELRKMQKKLENLFSQKISQIKNHKQNKQFSAQSNQKSLKLKSNYKPDKKQLFSPSPQTEDKQKSKNRGYYSSKKIPLFQNQILREKNITQILDNLSKQKQNKSRTPQKTFYGIIESPNKVTHKQNKLASANLNKIKNSSKMKNLNSDYLIY